MKFLLVICSTLFVTVLGGSTRIQAGKETEIEDVPYQVGLYNRKVLICGGSILSEEYVLTSAKCIPYSTDKFYLNVGNKTQNKGKKILAEKIYIHPDFDKYSMVYDVGIIKLGEKLRFGPTVQKITLPEENQNTTDGTVALVSGWGSMFYEGNPVPSLRSTEIPLINREVCAKQYKAINTGIEDMMICAGWPQGGTNTCDGDAGGPLVVDGKIIGITSFSHKCARPDFPSVFTEVSHPKIRSFIRNITGL